MAARSLFLLFLIAGVVVCGFLAWRFRNRVASRFGRNHNQAMGRPVLPQHQPSPSPYNHGANNYNGANNYSGANNYNGTNNYNASNNGGVAVPQPSHQTYSPPPPAYTHDGNVNKGGAFAGRQTYGTGGNW